MKKFTILFSLIFSFAATAQTKLYTPEELKKDADFYFTMLYLHHPNPYYFYPIDEFEAMKDSIYNQLNKPLNKADFVFILAQINSYLDTHSIISLEQPVSELLIETLTNKAKKGILSLLQLSNNQEGKLSVFKDSISQNLTLDSLKSLLKNTDINEEQKENYLLLPPLVRIINNKLFFTSEPNNSIIEIDGIPAQTLINESNKYYNKKLNSRNNSLENDMIVNIQTIAKQEISSPFFVKSDKNKEGKIIDGITTE